MKNPDGRGYIYAEERERLMCFEYITNGSLDTKITGTLLFHADKTKINVYFELLVFKSRH